MSEHRKSVGVIGSHEPDYPRHLVLEEALRNSGHTLHMGASRIGFPWRHLAIAKHVFSLPKEVKVIYATEGAHRLVPLMSLWAKMTGRKILFDPFLSRYNTRVEDRQLYKAGSLQAWIAHWQDWSSCKTSDFLIFDTEEHREYFYERYGLKAPAAVIPVGVPEELFTYPLPHATPPSGTFEVLFYGTFIPLQGIETLVEAATHLPDGIRITVIGRGQTYPQVMERVDALKVPASKLRFQEPVPFKDIPRKLAESHVALGIFGGTDKAARVVPNKVVQAAAMGRPIITGDTPAIRRYFQEGKNISLVPTGDGEALAKAILTLRDNPDICAALGGGARGVFETNFSLEAITKELAKAVAKLDSGATVQEGQ